MSLVGGPKEILKEESCHSNLFEVAKYGELAAPFHPNHPVHNRNSQCISISGPNKIENLTERLSLITARVGDELGFRNHVTSWSLGQQVRALLKATPQLPVSKVQERGIASFQDADWIRLMEIFLWHPREGQCPYPLPKVIAKLGIRLGSFLDPFYDSDGLHLLKDTTDSPDSFGVPIHRAAIHFQESEKRFPVRKLSVID